MDFFHKDGDGRSSRCKACARKAALAWNKANPERHKAKLAKWHSENKDKRKEYVERYKHRRGFLRKIVHDKLRAKALKHYGGVCICCGESEPGFLTVDHINGGGNKHRKEIGGGRIYYWLRANSYPDTFQVMCMNCNWGKHQNGGSCPHERLKLCVQ